MRKELQTVQGKLLKETKDPGGEDVSKERGLEKQVRILAARLDQVEREKDQANRQIEESNRRRDEELESIKQMISFEQERKAKASPAEGSRPEGVEVTINGPIETSDEERNDKGKGEEEPSSSWFCGCLPSSSGKDEEK